MTRVLEHADGVAEATWRAPGLVSLHSPDAAALIEIIEQVLTPVERDEVRVAVFPDGVEGDERLALAMAARTLGVQAARHRSSDLVELLGDPSRFYSVYQPIVDLDSGATVAHEALLRATAADGSEISAGELFSSAIEADLLHPLDRVGRESAIRDAAAWLGDSQLFVNFLPSSIYRPEICLATTMAACATHAVDPSQLVFEVVESDRVDSMEHLVDVVGYYRDNGSRIALDDVGEGYGTLSALARLRPDVVKVDMGLVQALPDPTAMAVVKAVVAIAHDIGARVIAEGIETAEQLDVVGELGADMGQGWHIGRPARPDTAA